MLKNLGGEFSNGKDTTELSKETISFTADKAYPDIQDPSFIKLDYRFVGATINEVFCCLDILNPLTAEKLNKSNERPMIWNEAETLAKAAYLTILVGLGQTKPESNILTDTKLLTDFTSSLSGLKSAVNLFLGPTNDIYSVLGKSTGPLGIKPSVILTSYVCQVPQLKPAGNLIVAAIVTDLVLLQAVWQIYKIATELYLSRVRSDINPSRAIVV